MATITFNIRADVPRKSQDRVLAKAAALPGVRSAGRIAPDVDEPLARRMCYADVADEDVDSVCAELAAMPEIELAGEPAVRFAI